MLRLLYLLCLGLGMDKLLVLRCHIMAFIGLTGAFFYWSGNGTSYFMSQMSQVKLGVTDICPLSVCPSKNPHSPWTNSLQQSEVILKNVLLLSRCACTPIMCFQM